MWSSTPDPPGILAGQGSSLDEYLNGGTTKVSDNIAMAREGTQFTADGISISWPWNGVRQVMRIPAPDRPLSFRRRVAEGHIVETDLPATDVYEPGKISDYRLLTGEEARRHKAIPAGPVIPVAEYLRYGDEAVNFYAQQEELSALQREVAFAEVESKRSTAEQEARDSLVVAEPVAIIETPTVAEAPLAIAETVVEDVSPVVAEAKPQAVPAPAAKKPVGRPRRTTKP